MYRHTDTSWRPGNHPRRMAMVQLDNRISTLPTLEDFILAETEIPKEKQSECKELQCNKWEVVEVNNDKLKVTKVTLRKCTSMQS